MAELFEAPLILCVDDNQRGLVLRKVVLESAGYRVLLACSGADALPLFRNNPVGGVVLDYRMPGMDGGEVAAEMRKLKPAIPILMLSGIVEIPPAVLDLVDKFIAKGAVTSLVDELRKRVPAPGPEAPKRAQREESLARSEKLVARSREILMTSRRLVGENRRHIYSGFGKNETE
ncbi:MAG: response regulator [Acidobacteria bacterium]|nr:response regulator [Acidobacteriota bacterium]